jgi:hypothetical protein
MADEYEQNHVHEVYQQIAGHFSATRFKVSETLREGGTYHAPPRRAARNVNPQLMSFAS